MKILAYADWHVCHSWSLLQVKDFERVHAHLLAYAHEHRPDLVLFLGDRFRARQPRDQIRALADRHLRALAGVQARHGGQLVCVVGNHDRYGESAGSSGNTYSTVDIFRDVMPNVLVLDQPGTTQLTCGALLHALPTGYAYRADFFNPDPQKINIFAFHGLVKGAVYDVGGLVEIREGTQLTLGDIDTPAYDLVLGGDCHVPQRFPLKRGNAGGYVGSTLRLTEADADEKRGFLDISIEKGQPPSFTFVEGGGPRFAKVALGVDPADWPDPAQYEGAIVIATLSGPAIQLKKLTDVQVREFYSVARQVKVHRVYEHESPAFVPQITAASSPFDDAVSYIRAVPDRAGLDEQRLIAKAATALGVESVKRGGIF